MVKPFLQDLHDLVMYLRKKEAWSNGKVLNFFYFNIELINPNTEAIKLYDLSAKVGSGWPAARAGGGRNTLVPSKGGEKGRQILRECSNTLEDRCLIGHASCMFLKGLLFLFPLGFLGAYGPVHPFLLQSAAY